MEMSALDRKDRQPSPSSSRGNVVDHDAPPGKPSRRTAVPLTLVYKDAKLNNSRSLYRFVI